MLIREFAITFIPCCLEGDKASNFSFCCPTLTKNMVTFGQVDWMLRRDGEKKNKKCQVIHRHKKNIIAMNTRGNVMTQVKRKKHGSEKLVKTTKLILIEFVSNPRKNRSRVKNKIMDRKRD